MVMACAQRTPDGQAAATATAINGQTVAGIGIRIDATVDILLAINGEDSDGETMRFAWSLRRVPASQISLTAPHLHRLHIGLCPSLGPCFRTTRIYDKTTRKACLISPA